MKRSVRAPAHRVQEFPYGRQLLRKTIEEGEDLNTRFSWTWTLGLALFWCYIKPYLWHEALKGWSNDLVLTLCISVTLLFCLLTSCLLRSVSILRSFTYSMLFVITSLLHLIKYLTSFTTKMKICWPYKIIEKYRKYCILVLHWKVIFAFQTNKSKIICFSEHFWKSQITLKT